MAIADVVDLLACPVCGSRLQLTGQTVKCPSGHTVDLARQGYLNLSGRPPPRSADTPAMVAARDRFLTAGHYRLLAEGITGAAVWSTGRDLRVLDCGAGTGYYLAAVLNRAPGSRGVAVDVSVAAARRAARAHARIGAVVADAWRGLPVQAGVLDVVLNVFAPRSPAEFWRVLAPTGRLVVATPAPEHLVELREALPLLDVGPDKQARLSRALDAYFLPMEDHLVRSVQQWSASTVGDAVRMGPNAFHLDADLEAGLAALQGPVSVTVAVSLETWVPRPAPLR